jgi:hypothetical protein
MGNGYISSNGSIIKSSIKMRNSSTLAKTTMMKTAFLLLLVTAAAEDFADKAASVGGEGDEDVVQEFLPKMSFSAKDYFREKQKGDAGACACWRVL